MTRRSDRWFVSAKIPDFKMAGREQAPLAELGAILACLLVNR